MLGVKPHWRNIGPSVPTEKYGFTASTREIVAWKLLNQKSPSEAPEGITSRKSYKRPSAQTLIDVYFLYTYGSGARRKLAASVTYASGSTS